MVCVRSSPKDQPVITLPVSPDQWVDFLLD